MSQLLTAIVLLSSLLKPTAATVSREDVFVNSDVGIRIHIREIRNTAAHRACDPILLVHGARVPGIASFDLPVPGGSLEADLAENVSCVYVIDIRGYGQSTRPLEMEEPPQNHPPIVRSVEAARDIDAAIELIRRRTGVSRVSLFGWATGGQWGWLLRDPAFGEA